MCTECWEIYGSPVIGEGHEKRSDRVLGLIRRVYAAPQGGTGGGLHVVLDDWNVEDDALGWCLSDENVAGLTEIERECAERLLRLRVEERAALLARFWGFYGERNESDDETSDDLESMV